MGNRKVRFIIRPVYVDRGPDYCLIFDTASPEISGGNIVPNHIIKYQGPIDRAMRKFCRSRALIGRWDLARPYFAGADDVKGYLSAIAI